VSKLFNTQEADKFPRFSNGRFSARVTRTWVYETAVRRRESIAGNPRQSESRVDGSGPRRNKAGSLAVTARSDRLLFVIRQLLIVAHDGTSLTTSELKKSLMRASRGSGLGTLRDNSSASIVDPELMIPIFLPSYPPSSIVTLAGVGCEWPVLELGPT
jgi:hypothetical protein